MRHSKDHVEYEIGDDTYSIPSASVDHIDAGGSAPAHPGPNSSNSSVPDIVAAEPSFENESDVATKVIRDGKVDTALGEQCDLGPKTGLPGEAWARHADRKATQKLDPKPLRQIRKEKNRGSKDAQSWSRSL